LIVPGWYGMASVKWLTRIEAIAKPFQGYQQRVYSYMVALNDPSPTPVTRIKPRSLMIPPGIPDFITRKRLLRPGSIALTGRAWTGQGKIVKVEVSVDDGKSFMQAILGKPLDTYAWCDWALNWNAKEGKYAMVVRATDDSGYTQPQIAPWNSHGYSNNGWHRVEVEVKDYTMAKY